MPLLAAVLFVLQSTAPALPGGQLVLGRSSVRAGESVPALLVLAAPDTLQALSASATVTALPAGLLWWRGAEQRCGNPPPDARLALQWNGTVRGDEPLALCARAGGDGPLRLTATLRALQPDGTWRTRSVVSEAATGGERWYASSAFLAILTALLGLGSGMLVNRVQLAAQQKGEREMKRLEFDAERRTREVELERKVFDSVTAEVQRNADALRVYTGSQPVQGEKELQLTLAGMQAVIADPALAAHLRDGAGRDYGERMRRVYRVMGQFNLAARNEPDPARRRELARQARDLIEAELQP